MSTLEPPDSLPARRSPTAVVPVRWFRPPVAAEHGPEPTYRVEVAAVLTIAGETLAACRDRDDPRWHYEVLTTRPVAVGATGTVQVVGRDRLKDLNRIAQRNRPRWALTLDPIAEHPPSAPGSHPNALPDSSCVEVIDEEKAGWP